MRVYAVLAFVFVLRPAVLLADGATFESPDEGFRLRIGGYVQADARFFVADDDERGTDQLLLRRVRPIVEGTVFRHLDYRVMPDFAGGVLVLQDAYVDVHRLDWIRLRIGKYKEPFGLERLVSATNLVFAERGLPTLLVPNRDVGAELWGEVAGETLSWALGVFDGVPDGGSTDQDTNDEKDFAARAFVQPFRPMGIAPLGGLGLGFAASAGVEAGAFSNQPPQTATGLSSLRTSGQVPFFSFVTGATADETVLARGPRVRLSPQAAYEYGPVAATFEYVRSSYHVALGDAHASIQNTAWQLAGSFVLGAERARGAIVPRHDFHPFSEGTWGALEIAARYGSLDVDRGAFRRGFADPAKSAAGARAWAVGVNWFPHRSLKAVLDFEHTVLVGRGVGADLPDEDLLLGRLQIVF